MIQSTRDSLRCPACSKDFSYGVSLKVTPHPLDLTAPGDQEGKPVEYENFDRSREFKCPACSGVLQIYYRITVLDVLHIARAETVLDPVNEVRPKPQPKAKRSSQYQPLIRMTPEEGSLVENCRTNGLLGVFSEVVKAQTHVQHRPPRDIARFFITFLRSATLVTNLQADMMSEFRREFPGYIQFWRACRIGMVVSDGTICRFVPMRSMTIAPKRTARMNLLGVSVDRECQSFEYIQRTTFGYVPPNARIFLESLRNSLGGRGRDRNSTRIR